MSSARTALEAFVSERPRLVSVAYSVLGDVTEAEDVVQEAWLRLERTGTQDILDITGWLVVTTARLALDVARSARARREAYFGPWLPEPLTIESAVEDPENVLLRQESVHLAMLAVLEALSPAQRAVFVLHDVFRMPFDEIAAVVHRSPAACRQLAARARVAVQSRAPRFESDRVTQQHVLDAFARACEDGDVVALTAVLDPAVVLRSDGGGKVRAALRPVLGSDHVARFLLGIQAQRAYRYQPALVNGWPGLLVLRHGAVSSIATALVADDRIVALDLQRNPDKLARARAATFWKDME